MTPVNKGPLEFRPMQGLLGIGSRLAARLGLSEIWEGDEGLVEVARRKLAEAGVPETPIALTPKSPMTPVQMAEHAGFIRRRRKGKVK